MADRSVVVALRSMGITTYTTEVATASRETMAYDRSLRAAGKAADSYARAVAAAGAESSRAVAAQTRYADSLKRVAIAEEEVWVAAERAGAAQVASAERAAAAQEAAAAKQVAATKKIGSTFGTIGVLAAVGLGLAAKAASDFNAEQAQLQALTRGSAETMAKLAAASKQYADLGISATEATQAEIELQKANIGVNDQLSGALTGTLNLAAAGQMNVADATQIAATAMTQFQKSGKDVPHIADLLAAGADKALGSVQDLGMGLTQAGLPAHQLGVSIEDTVATLAEFAQAGLIGERGGTTLKQMFLKLENPTVAAAAALDKYNISLYDSQGNFVGMSKLAGELQTGLKGVSLEERNAALATIFGSRAIQGANVLYQDGEAGARKWAKAVDDSGFAAEQAHGKMDSLQGDLQKLSAQATNTAIGLGQKLQPALRAVAQDLTAVLGVVDDLPDPLKEAAALTIAFTAAVGLSVFAFTRAKLAMASMGTQLGMVGTKATAARLGFAAAGIGLMTLNSHVDDSNLAMKGLLNVAGGAAAGAIFGPWGAAAGAAGGILQTWGEESQGAAVSVDGLTQSLNQNTGAFTDATTRWAAMKAASMSDDLDKAGISVQTMTEALLGNKTAIDQVTHASGGNLQAQLNLWAVLGKAKITTEQYNAALKAQKQHEQDVAGEHARLAVAAGASSKVFDELGVGVAAAGRATAASAVSDAVARAQQDALTASTQKLTLAQQQLNGVFANRLGGLAGLTLSIESAQASMKDLGDASKNSGRALDVQSHAGATLVQQLSSMADAASKVTGSSKTQARAVNQTRDAMVKLAHQHGLTLAAAEELVGGFLDSASAADIARSDMKKLVDQYNLTPHQIKTAIAAEGATTAAQEVKALRDYIDQLHNKSVDIGVRTTYTSVGTSGGGGHVIDGGATGGEVRGVGTATSDSNLIAASRGEFMVKARSAQSVGYGVMHEINRTGRIPQGLSGGGTVGRGWMTSSGSGNGPVLAALRDISVRVSKVEEALGRQIHAHVDNAHEMADGVHSVATSVVDGREQTNARWNRSHPS